MTTRSMTREVRIGNTKIGGGNPIRIQSMTNTRTSDVRSTVDQILRLEKAGCEIIRCTVPDMESAEAIAKIKEEIHIPLVADIHFDYRLAIAAVEHGADKIRINPGNIGSNDRVRAVVKACQEHHVPIRVGVNSGSVRRDLVEKYGGVTHEALMECACENVAVLEQMGFEDIVVSLKATNMPLCADAYLDFAEKYAYPLHLGITEAGTRYDGAIKSAMGLGIMLHQGIGDTIRVSLTDDPVEEIDAAQKILTFAGLRTFGIEWISCPTCGRTQINLMDIANRAKEELRSIRQPLKIAIMGCVVNGPGEAHEADFGIAGGKGEGLVFRKGEILCKVPEDQLIHVLKQEVEKYVAEKYTE